MITRRDRIAQGGTVLVVLAVFQGVLAAAMGFYFYRQSYYSATTARVNEGQSNAQSAAEFATELTIANLVDVEYKEEEGEIVSISSDWVGSDPYHTTGDKQFMRIISGTVGDYNYQVQVVPVREMREHIKNSVNTNYPDDWMVSIPVEPYNYEIDPVRKFSAAYEITATANNRFSGDTAGRGVSQTIVGLEYQSAYNEQDKAATLHLNKPSGLVDDTILVSAEDHYSIKTVAKSGIIDDVVQGMVTIKALATELNSVNNNWWNYGRQTLHFQLGEKPNPHRPRTVNFSTNDIDRQMIRYNPDITVEPDQYITGGKYDVSNDFRMDKLYDGSGWQLLYRYGRGINIGTDGLIIETKASQATPDVKLATETISIGDTRDLSKLYFLNIEPGGTVATAGSNRWPANTATAAQLQTWKDSDWKMVFFPEHPKNETQYNNPSMPNYIRPLDNWNTPKKRRFPMMLILMNEEGALLVREYDDGKYSSPTSNAAGTPPNDWRGTYTWMFKLGYTSSSYNKSTQSAQITAGGSMYYQGAWLKPTPTNTTKGPKNFAKVMNPRLFSLQEFYGVKMDTDSKGVPCKKENGVIVAGVPDILLDASGNEIPYDPNGTGTQFDELAQRADTADNWGITEESKKYWPPIDGIYVRLPDDADDEEVDWIAPSYGDNVVRKYKKYQTVKDFATRRDINKNDSNTNDPNYEPDFRDVAGVYLSFETQPESNPSSTTGFYFKYEMTVAIVYPKHVEVVADEDSLSDIFRQWWQGDHQEGLTGKMGHTALSNFPVEPEGEQQDYFDSALAAMPVIEDEESQIPGINVMVDSNTGAISGFNRASFVVTGDEAGTLEEDVLNASNGSDDYYYGDDDLWQLAVILYEQNLLKDKLKPYEAELQSYIDDEDIAKYNARWAELIQIFAEERIHEKNPEPIKLYHLKERFNEHSGYEQLVFCAENKEVLLDPAALITTRSFVEMAFGGRSDRLPAVYLEKASPNSDIYVPVDGFAPLQDAPHTVYPLSFVPGETEFGNNTLTLDPNGYVDIVYNEATRYTATQPNGQPIEAKFIWLNHAPADQENMTTIHKHPSWFDQYVDDLYERYKYEHRGALGWHREGPGGKPTGTLTEAEEKRHRIMYGDHYEFVIMSEMDQNEIAFNPYQTFKEGDKEFIALYSYDGNDGNDDDGAVYDGFHPRLKPANEMPTFVIEGDELDGAGILVVNGNLHVKTRFAYHGTLVVMGDIIVTPQRYDLYDRKGNRVDLDGNIVTWNPDNSTWTYIDSNGDEQVASSLPEEWRGELIVQGKVMAGGEVRTESVRRDPTDPDEIPGIIDIRSSTGAIEDTTGTWIKVGPNEKFSASRLVWSNAEPRLDD